MAARTDPHHDFEAERAILGGVLLDPEGLVVVTALLSPQDFYHPSHVLIFEVMLALQARGEPIDLVTLAAALRDRDRLNTVGGGAYLGALTDTIPTTAHLEAYVRIVRDLACKRRARAAHEAAARMILEGHTPEAARVHVERVVGPPAAGKPAGRVGDDLDELIAMMHRRATGQERALQTPWSRLDAVLGGGLWPGFYVLVGGTGAGKTQFAVQASVHTAQTGVGVLYLALELSRHDIAARVLGVVADEPWSFLLRGALTEAQLASVVMRAEATVRALPFYTECAPPYGYSIETLTARAWALRPSLIVLDYLQLCGRPGEDLRASISRASYAARSLARDLNAVVLALSSTARENYAKLAFHDESDPTDLVGLGKESGEVEYASDGVLVLARDTNTGIRRVVVAKNRSGPTGVVDLQWDGHQFTEPESMVPSPIQTTVTARRNAHDKVDW
jgi:replicative DNA helicase